MLAELYVFVFLENEWVPCGLLEFTDAGRFSKSRFRYGKRYLQRENAMSIDPVQLPLGPETFQTEDGFALFNGLRDAAPDRWGRYLLEKKFARDLSELEYLAASGQDRVGALSFSSTPTWHWQIYTPDGFKQDANRRLDLGLCDAAVEDAMRSENTDRLKRLLEYGPSLGGARPKATVLWEDKLAIAKFSISLDSKNEPAIEFSTMKLAKEVGLNVPEIRLVSVNDRDIYLIDRFDRNSSLQPIPFVSALTLTGMHESDYSNWSYKSIADAILKYGANPIEDLEELFKRLVFNILVYNNDDHLRNFGFLYDFEAKGWRLSPLYDVVPSVVHTDTRSLALSIGVDGKSASLKNALSAVSYFRLTMNKAEQIVESLCEGIVGWEDKFVVWRVSEREVKMLKNSIGLKI